MIIPLGLTDAPRGRTPWVSIVLATLCAGVLLMEESQTATPPAGFAARTAFDEYWKTHPYLVPSPELVYQVNTKQLAAAVRERDRRRTQGTLPDAKELQRQQDEWSSLLLATKGGTIPEEWGLVPARGWAQAGWLTHMFVHGGWLHLIGNLIFFAAVGPVLEKLLGHLVFLGFYLLGGFLAAFCQALLMGHSDIPLVGASGAIAACMGAFTVRFFTDSLRVLLFGFWVRKVVSWPVWAWSSLWLINQLFMLYVGGAVSGGVAVAAHVAGFVFGTAVALALIFTRVGDVLPAVPDDEEDGPLLNRADDLASAEAAAARHDLPTAIAAYRSVLKRFPDSIPAQWGLTQVLFKAGEIAEATRAFDVLLAKWFATGGVVLVQQALATVVKDLNPRLLQPPQAGRAAPYLEAHDQLKAMDAYEVAARHGSGEACIRLAELRWKRGDAEGAQEVLGWFKAIEPRTEVLAVRANALMQAMERKSA